MLQEETSAAFRADFFERIKEQFKVIANIGECANELLDEIDDGIKHSYREFGMQEERSG